MLHSCCTTDRPIYKIISFDVGIKNMAYCILSVNTSSEKEHPFEIVDWNVLNLIEREPTTENPCCQVLSHKKGQPEKPCTKPAKYKIMDSVDTTSTHFFCEKHAKSANNKYIIPTERFSSSQLKKMDLDQLNSLLQKYTLSISQTKKSAIENLETYFTKNTMELINKKKKSANEMDLILLGKHMMVALDANPHTIGLTHVIIENQISPIANRMKTVQGMLAQYFIMRVPGSNIEFISSANKLKTFISKKEQGEKSGEYKQHKRDGIFYTDQVLQHNQFISCWHSHFDSSKKKDDLADAFLQGLWYLINKKIIITAENLKINSI